MDYEILCHIEFYRTKRGYIARMTSELGGRREYHAISFDELLEKVLIELQQEFYKIL